MKWKALLIASCKCIEETAFAVIPAKAGIQKPALEGLNQGSLILKNTGFPIKTSGMTTFARASIVCIICIFLCSEVGDVFAQGITGSVHDFRSKGYTTEICNVCHTPHNANSTVGTLWNHELSNASYTLYSSPTLDVPIVAIGLASKLCLSCHDGTVAIDSFGGTTGTSFVSGSALIGTDLSDDHPVGVIWKHQTVDGTSCLNCHFTIPLPFYDAKIECATCHDPHNNVPATNGKLLRKPRAGSVICLICHSK